MSKVNYVYSSIAIASLMALALYGMVAVKFIAVCFACMLTATILFGLLLLFFLVVDKVIDFFYMAR